MRIKAPGKKGRVLVIGGGVAGMAAGLMLAGNGYQVYVVEREPAIGGWAATFSCKATEACSKCSVCLGAEELRQVAAHPRISILTDSEVTGLSGKMGDFRVSVCRKPRFIDPEKCTACGLCYQFCPLVPPAIYLPFPEAVPHSYTIDKTRCLRFNGNECSICWEKCPWGAVDFDKVPTKLELAVEAIIVATGFDVFDAREVPALGYGRYPNVLTGLDLERMFSNDGFVRLPSNGKEPQNVAFIQCVGSRDNHIGNGYCSQVCCKYAMRFAKLLQYQNLDTRATIFYMDLQTAGKGFSQFYEECQQTIRFVRGIPSEVRQLPSGELEVKYENLAEGRVTTEVFDLVILSVGINPRKDSADLARVLGINLGDDGFFDTRNQLQSTATNVDGIFLAGTCQGPKDIPDSIAHGVAAASRVMQALTRRVS